MRGKKVKTLVNFPRQCDPYPKLLLHSRTASETSEKINCNALHELWVILSIDNTLWLTIWAFQVALENLRSDTGGHRAKLCIHRVFTTWAYLKSIPRVIQLPKMLCRRVKLRDFMLPFFFIKKKLIATEGNISFITQ